MTRHLFVGSKTILSTNRNILNQSKKYVEFYFILNRFFYSYLGLFIIREHHEIIGILLKEENFLIIKIFLMYVELIIKKMN